MTIWRNAESIIRLFLSYTYTNKEKCSKQRWIVMFVFEKSTLFLKPSFCEKLHLWRVSWSQGFLHIVNLQSTSIYLNFCKFNFVMRKSCLSICLRHKTFISVHGAKDYFKHANFHVYHLIPVSAAKFRFFYVTY